MTYFWDRYFLVMFHEMTQKCNKIWRASQNFFCLKFTSWKSIKEYEIFYAALHCEQMMSNCLLDLIFLAPFNSSPIIISFKLFPKSWEAYYHRQIFDRKWNWLNVNVLKHFSSETIIRTQMGPEVLILSNTNSKFLEGLITHSSMLSEITYIQQKCPWCLSWPAGTSIS